MGRTAIRSAVAFPGVHLSGVITSSSERAGTDVRWAGHRRWRGSPGSPMPRNRAVPRCGGPQLSIVVRADVPGGTRADGGNTTAANRLLGAIGWLATQKPAIYDGLDVPLQTSLPRRWKRSAGPTDVAETRVAFTESAPRS